MGGKIFATVPPEGEHLHVFAEEEQRQVALALEHDAVEKLLWGKRVVGLRVCLAKAKPSPVNGLLSQVWSRRVPKSLVASAHNAYPAQAMRLRRPVADAHVGR